MDPIAGIADFRRDDPEVLSRLSHSAGTCTSSMTSEEQGLARTGGQGLAPLLDGTYATYTP